LRTWVVRRREGAMKLCTKATAVDAAGVRREVGKLGKENSPQSSHDVTIEPSVVVPYPGT
jgi:hypothetical protein